MTRQTRQGADGYESRRRGFVLICMQSAGVRIEVDTHDELKRLASSLGTTVGETVTLAVRRFRQERLGEESAALSQPARLRGSMPNSGDIVEPKLGMPSGREAPSRRPAVVTAAQRLLDASPSVIQVVPLAKTRRGFRTEVVVEPSEPNGPDRTSAAQCQHIRAVSVGRVQRILGNVGRAALTQGREVLRLILDTSS